MENQADTIIKEKDEIIDNKAITSDNKDIEPCRNIAFTILDNNSFLGLDGKSFSPPLSSLFILQLINLYTKS